MMFRFFIHIVLLGGMIFLSFEVKAQEYDLDSLRKVVSKMEQDLDFKKDTVYIDALNQLAYHYWTTSPDSVMSLSKRALALSRDIDFSKGEIFSMINIGTAYYEKGLYGEAMEVERLAYDLAVERDSKMEIGVLSINISMVYIALGMYQEALQLTFKGLDFAEKNQFKKQIARHHWTIAQIYELQNRFQDALEWYSKSRKLFAEGGFKMVLHMLDISIGNMHLIQSQPEKAMIFYQEALRTSESMGNLAGNIRANIALGNFMQKTNKPDKALEFFLEANEIAYKMNAKAGISEASLKISEVLLGMKRYSDALIFANVAMGLAEEIKKPSILVESNLLLTNIYVELSNFELALNHYRTYSTLKETLMNKEVESKLVRIEEQYKHQKNVEAINADYSDTLNHQKSLFYFSLAVLVLLILLVILLFLNIKSRRKATEILMAKQKKIDEQNIELARIGKFKDRLLSVVAHDLKSPINSLHSMVELFNDGEFTKEEVDEMMNQISIDIGALSDFINNLLLWAKGQMTHVETIPKKFDIKESIDKTISLLSNGASKKGIELTVKTQPLQVFADEEMVKIVIRNFLSNAIKFCKVGDLITVATHIDSEFNMLVVSVKDTGVGIPESKLENIFNKTNLSTLGTSHEIGTGLGLVLCKEYIEMNHGEIGVNSKLGEGSEFWFSLPLEKF